MPCTGNTSKTRKVMDMAKRTNRRVVKAKSRVLVVGDLHCPVMHDGYIDHLRTIARKYKTDRTVLIGDVVDLHGISYHEKDPDLYSAGSELGMAIKQVQAMNKAFPEAVVMTGNHDDLPARQARTLGMPSAIVRSPEQFLETKGWKWLPRMSTMKIDGVKYAHGDRGRQGGFASYHNAITEGCSYVEGHKHSLGGVWWHANEERLIFGMNVGSGVDRNAVAMLYGRGLSKKPILGCGVVIEGTHAYFEPMEL